MSSRTRSTRSRTARSLVAVAAGAAVAASVAFVATTPAAAASGEPEPVVATVEIEPEDSSLVRTEDGVVRGTVTDSYRSFQGIPYAAAPVGERRWGSPQRPEPWPGVREATAPASPCAQAGDFIGDVPSTQEDCLYLNVTTPRDATADVKPKPVMVWIHGGGFTWGSGGIYGAERLAAQGDVVVVTFNYRLGVFGFMAHPALDSGPAEHLSGNLGIEDQQAVLQWVRDNAAAFGGDPNNVTIFGESAGGMSGCAHLSAPGSAGLFERVIIQSGPCTLRWQFPDTWRAKPRAQAEAQGTELATAAGCADPATAAECLRSKTTEELLAADGGQHGFGPSYGGGVIPEDPARQLAAGETAEVPVMHGITRDEHVTFQAGIDTMMGPVAPADYPAVLGQYLGVDAATADRVAREYPLSDFAGSTSWATASVLTDWGWGCPATDVNRQLSRENPTFAYEFSDRTAPWFAGPDLPAYPTGAFHAGELQYLFSGAYARAELSPEQQLLSDRMIGYWTQFARTGDPNGNGLPEWPHYDEGGHVQSLAAGPEGVGGVDMDREHRCGFWRSVS
ncbi:carboxylesterase/lipase family protein [Pseudonocardia sp. CA-142604]|uniref:carboxylesterase/lipase family protein n=1 Tax=Pseudonocardia sp. CA-142604 TaxID=3240024 RepID=UPI003D905917